MASLTIIAAVGKNLELGINNDLIWKIKEDMKFFREYTIGKKIIMGSKTFYSLPRLLPNRKHIVITSKNLDLGEDIMIFHSIEDLINYLKFINEEVMVIGGASIYKELLIFADTMILTEIDQTANATVFFPKFNSDEWNSTLLGEYNELDFSYKRVKYLRK